MGPLANKKKERTIEGQLQKRPEPKLVSEMVMLTGAVL